MARHGYEQPPPRGWSVRAEPGGVQATARTVATQSEVIT